MTTRGTMIPPDNAKIIEGKLATFWFDESGILCARSKDVPRTLEMQVENYPFIREITGNKRVCLLSDTTRSTPQNKETRDYSASEIPKVFKAMAIISASALGKFSANIFITLKDQPIPMRFFSDEEEAKKWLKNYL